MRALVHVMGSVQGYSTLRGSSELTPSDIGVLETLGFGQTDGTAYLASLASNPAGMGRPLPSGRYAITRCFAGLPDKAGRRTLLFGSLVVDGAAWSTLLASRAWELLWNDRIWRDVMEGDATQIDFEVERKSQRLLDRDLAIGLLDAWLRQERGSRKVAVEDTRSACDTLPSLAAILPIRDRCRLSWGVRTLSAGAPVGVMCVAGVGGPHGRATVGPTPLGGLRHPFCQALDLFWAPGGPQPVQFIEGVGSVDDLGAIEAALAAPVAEPRTGSGASRRVSPMPRRWRKRLLGPMAIIGGIGVTVLVIMLARHERSAAPDTGETTPAEAVGPAPAEPSDGRSTLEATDPREASLRGWKARRTWGPADLSQWLDSVHPIPAGDDEIDAARVQGQAAIEWWEHVGGWGRRVDALVERAPSNIDGASAGRLSDIVELHQAAASLVDDVPEGFDALGRKGRDRVEAGDKALTDWWRLAQQAGLAAAGSLHRQSLSHWSATVAEVRGWLGRLEPGRVERSEPTQDHTTTLNLQEFARQRAGQPAAERLVPESACLLVTGWPREFDVAGPGEEGRLVDGRIPACDAAKSVILEQGLAVRVHGVVELACRVVSPDWFRRVLEAASRLSGSRDGSPTRPEHERGR